MSVTILLLIECHSILRSHNPDVPLSVKILEQLEAARTKPYPPLSRSAQKPRLIKARRYGDPTHYGPAPIPPPLNFAINLVKGPPTPDQFVAMNAFIDTAHSLPGKFLHAKSLPLSEYPTSATDLTALLKKKPEVLKWPIIV